MTLSLLLCGAILVAGCAPASAPTSLAASVEALGQAWQSVPFATAARVLAAAEGACREQSPVDIPTGSPLALADVRGGARIVLVFATANSGTSCDATLNADRSWTAIVRGGLDARLPADGLARIDLLDHASSIRPSGPPAERTTVFGRYGAGVAAVEVLLEDTVVHTTAVEGWFVAWWPTDDAEVRIKADDAAGNPLDPGQA